jgi:hypothetical protein
VRSPSSKAPGTASASARRSTEAKQLVPVPEEQAALKRIHKLADRGVSRYQISADLAELGVVARLVFQTILGSIADLQPFR